MSLSKDEIIEICNQFRFAAFSTEAAGFGVDGASSEKVESCDNHLDADFIKMLDSGAHLDLDLMPL